MHFLVVSTQQSSLFVMEYASECYKSNGRKCELDFICVVIDVPVVILGTCSVLVKWLYTLFLLVLPLYKLYLVH